MAVGRSMHNLHVAGQLLPQSLNQRRSTAGLRRRCWMRAEGHDDKAANQIVNDRAVLDCKVGDSRHALRNLQWTLASHECEDELDASLLDGRSEERRVGKE